MQKIQSFDWLHFRRVNVKLLNGINKCSKLLEKKLPKFSVSTTKLMSKYLKFKRLIAKAGLTIRERHVHYICPSLSILGRFKSVLLCWEGCPEVSWILKVLLLKLPIVASEKKPDPSWTRSKLADSTMVTEAVGRVEVSVRAEIVV